MGEWRQVALGQIAEVRVSNVDKKTLRGERVVQLCNYMDVYSNDYIRGNLNFMTASATTAEIVRFKVELGDVLITKDSETPDDIGIPTVVIDEIDNLVCGYHVALIKPNKSLVDPIYLSKQLGRAETAGYFSRYAAGSTRYGLPTGAMTRTPIALPPLAQQKKIATVLSSIDTAIEKTEALIAKYQQIKAGLVHDLFTRGVLPNGQLRPTREQAPDLYRETAIGWIPKGWRLSDLRACLVENPTNGIYKSANLIGDGSLMVGQTAFTSERSIDFSMCRRGFVDANEHRRYGLAKEDILVTRVFATVQGVGLPTLVPELPEPAVFESNMMRLRVDSATALPRLLFEWLRGQQARSFIHGKANASNQSSINQADLNPLPVPLPELNEQLRMAAVIAGQDFRHTTERAALSKLRNQKLGLMQDLLTGKVPVKVESKELEPA